MTADGCLFVMGDNRNESADSRYGPIGMVDERRVLGRAPTVRNYFVYATDIDGDGVMELPNPQQLPYFGVEGESGNYIIHWYNISLDGQRTDKLTTYHNYSAETFMNLSGIAVMQAASFYKIPPG